MRHIRRWSMTFRRKGSDVDKLVGMLMNSDWVALPRTESRASMPRKPKVAVIGAGIGGLTAAVALHQRDIDVEVYEQSPQIAEIGAGVSLSPNAVKAFRALGLDAAITAIGFESDNQLVRAWNSGDVISKVFRKGVYEKEFGAPYLSAHRADLVDVLRRQLPDRVFHLGARCVGVETSDTGARARFADGAAIE